MKLNKTEFNALVQLLAAASVEEPQCLSEVLMTAVLKELHDKLCRRIFSEQKKYKVSLTPAESIAFWMTFNDSTPEHYEGNLALKICNDTHQKYLSTVI
jgi:uncharacterized protein VirK/YbjX